jgi:hypothetical protein
VAVTALCHAPTLGRNIHTSPKRRRYQIAGITSQWHSAARWRIIPLRDRGLEVNFALVELFLVEHGHGGRKDSTDGTRPHAPRFAVGEFEKLHTVTFCRKNTQSQNKKKQARPLEPWSR